MFWSLKIKYALQVYACHSNVFVKENKNYIFVSHSKPKDSREFRVFQVENANK